MKDHNLQEFFQCSQAVMDPLVRFGRKLCARPAVLSISGRRYCSMHAPSTMKIKARKKRP